MRLPAIALAILLKAIAPGAASAAPPPTPAQVLVSGISVQRTALAEAKIRKPASDTSVPIVSRQLVNRMEVTAGSDHLVGTPGFLKQSSLFAEARYRLLDWLQFGGSAAIRVQGDGDGTTYAAAQLLFGPTFNLGIESGIQNAFFITPKIGPTLVRNAVKGEDANYHAKLALAVTAGKRFAIGKNIAFAPAIGAVWQMGQKACFVIEPIAFSIFF